MKSDCLEGPGIWRTAERCFHGALEANVRTCSIVKCCNLFEIQRGSPRFRWVRGEATEGERERDRESHRVVFPHKFAKASGLGARESTTSLARPVPCSNFEQPRLISS